MYKENLLFDLSTKKEELENDIKTIEELLPKYRKGSLFKQGDYYYIKCYEAGKTVSTYIGKELPQEKIKSINRELKNHKTLTNKKKELEKELKEIMKMIKRYGGRI